jgi:hypothetical protein
MRLSKLAFVVGAAVALVVSAASASATANDPCKVLTAGKFSEIMGYTATIDKTASTQMSCFYQGPDHSGAFPRFNRLQSPEVFRSSYAFLSRLSGGCLAGFCSTAESTVS